MLQKLSKQFVDIVIEEITNEDNMRTIKNKILDPLVKNILIEIQPYVLAAGIYFISTFIMIILLVIILLSEHSLVY